MRFRRRFRSGRQSAVRCRLLQSARPAECGPAPPCRSVRRPQYRARAPAPRSDPPQRRVRWRARSCHCRDCARRDRERPSASMTPGDNSSSACAAFCFPFCRAPFFPPPPCGEGSRVGVAKRTRGSPRPSAGEARNLRGPALRQAAGAGRALRAVAAELIEPELQIDAVAAEAAFGQNRGDFGGLLARAEPMRIHDHAGEPRRQRQRAQALALRR